MEGTLEKIGLSKDEIQVYATIVQFGYRTVGQIQSYYKQSGDVISAALGSLANRGYIKEIKAKNTEGTSYFIPLPPQIKLTEDVSLRLENELKALSEDVKTDWNKTMNNFRSQLASFHENITLKVDNHAVDITTISKQFLDSLSTAVSTGKTEMSEILERINSETSTLSATNSDSIAKAAQRVRENVATSFDSTIHKIGEHHETFKSRIEETFNTLQQEHNERTHVQLSAILEKVDAIKGSLSVQMQQFLENAESKRNIINEITNTSISQLQTDSKTVSQNSSKKLSATVDKIVSNYDIKLDEYQEKVKQILTSLNEELKNLEEATTNRIRTSIDRSKETAVNILKENENQFAQLINNTKVDSVEKLGELITKTENKTADMKTQLSIDLTSYLQEFKKNSDDLLAQLKKGIESGFKLFEASLSTSIEKVSDQIILFIQEIMSTFEETSNVYLDNLSKTTVSYQKALDKRTEQFSNSHEEYKQNFISHLKDLKNSVVSNIGENVKNNEDAIKNLFLQKEEQFKNDIVVFSDDFSKRGRDIRDEVPNLVQINYQASLERLKELDDQFKSAISKIAEINSTFQGLDMKNLQRVFGKDEAPRIYQLLGSMNRDIELIQDNVGSKIDEMISTFSSSMNSLSNEIFEKINARLDELTRFRDNTIHTVGQSLESSRTELGNQFSKSLTEMKTTIDETYNAYEEQFNEIQDTGTGALKEVIGAESQAFNEVTKKIKSSLEDLVKVAKSSEEDAEVVEKTKMQLHIEEGLGALKASKEEILTLMKKNNDEVMTNLREILKTNIDSHSNHVDKTTTSMDGTMKTLQAEFENAKNALDTDISVTLDEAVKNYKAQTSKVENDIDQLIEQEIQQFMESTEGLMAELNVSPEKSSLLEEAIALTKGDLQKIAKDYPKWVKSDTSSFVAKLSETINGFQTQTQAEINVLYESVQNDLNKTHEQMSTEFESNITSIQEEFDKENKDYELNITHQINSFVTNSDSNSSALVTNIQGTRDTLTDAIVSGNETISTDLSNLENAISDLFDSFLISFKEKLEKAKQDSQVLDTQKEQYSLNLMNFKEELVKGTQKEVEAVDTNITGILSSIPSKIDVVLEATGESMKLLKSVLSLGKGIEPSPIEDIWLVVGKEQTGSTMMSLFRNTKSSATIISPSIDWIDVEFLDTFGRKLELVTNTSAHGEKDKAILSKLLGMGNVIVKDDPQLTVFLGTRDGIEEGFLGHKAPSGEPLLITTFNEEMVKEITKIYYEYRSRPPIRA